MHGVVELRQDELGRLNWPTAHKLCDRMFASSIPYKERQPIDSFWFSESTDTMYKFL